MPGPSWLYELMNRESFLNKEVEELFLAVDAARGVEMAKD